jgi:hypothetical protein
MSVEIINCEQGSEEWFLSRLGIPTASAFGTVMAKGQGKTRKAYMLKLLGERMTGEMTESYTNHHMERGHEMEPEARETYAFMKDCEPIQVGFIRNGNKGASPDSLVGDDGLLEIKTKLPHLQIQVLLEDRLPPEHKPQVQGQIWTAEREWCDFVSYWPKLPVFIKRVYRDEDYIKSLSNEVDRFVNDMNELEETIRQKYGFKVAT